MKYKPIFNQEQLIFSNVGSGTIVVCGWMPKERVKKEIEEFNGTAFYAALGQLYNAASGVEYLLRNLLYNPQISRVVLLAATRQDMNSKSVESAYNFLSGEFILDEDLLGRPCWGAEGGAKVSALIPRDAIVDRLAHCEIEIAYSLEQLKEILLVKTMPNKAEEEDRLSFLEEQADRNDLLPTALEGHIVRERSLSTAWIELLYRIRTGGKLQKTHHGTDWQELLNLMVIVEDNFRLPADNFLPVNSEFLAEYIPQVTEDLAEKESVKYTYGSRMRSHFGVDQVQAVIDKLKREPSSASAVISLWDAKLDTSNSPCLNHLWFRISSEKLYLTATFRSNDMFGAWCANAIALRTLQQLVATDLSRECGSLTTVSQSAHIYADCFAYADLIINSRRHPRFKQDPVGSFIISRDSSSILTVRQEFPTGSMCRQYKGDDIDGLLDEIVLRNPSIAPTHVAYLAREFRRAQERADYRQP